MEEVYTTQVNEYAGHLYHHGIKGQRWGIRRYQSKDGSLTPAGKKRYYDTSKPNALKKNKTVSTKSTYEVSKKSKHRLKLEEQYKKFGMTDEEAQIAANKRIRTEKILIGAAALTVAACATYIAVKARKERIDGVIKAGETLSRIERQDTDGKLHDVFYVAHDKKDQYRYKHLLGFSWKERYGRAYIMELSAERDVRVASMDQCRKAFRKLYLSDSDFKDEVMRHIPGIDGMSKRQQYDYFNQALVRMHTSDASKKFYDTLRSAGYGAIQDVNDMKYSGYHTRNPLIVFGNKAGNIMVQSVRELTEDLREGRNEEWNKASMEEFIEETVDNFLGKAGPLSAAVLTSAAVATYTSDPNKHNNTQGGTSKWS